MHIRDSGAGKRLAIVLSVAPGLAWTRPSCSLAENVTWLKCNVLTCSSGLTSILCVCVCVFGSEGSALGVVLAMCVYILLRC